MTAVEASPISPTADPLEGVRSLATAMREAADETERERRLPATLVEEMRRAGLFHLAVARDYGGLETDPVTIAKVVEEAAAADGSAGWCVMIASQNAAFSGYLAPEAAHAIWGSGAIVAGTARPIGRAVPAEGGYSASGRWPFASGSSHADYFAGECIAFDNGEQVRHPDGSPVSHMVFVPRDLVTIHDTWHTTGLRGTASNDFSFEDVHVPEAFTLKMFPSPQHPWPLYGSLALIFITHGAHALGVADAAVKTASELARTKVGWGTNRPMSENARVQSTIAEAFVLVESAREHLHGATARLWEALQRGEEAGKLNARVRLATSNAATASVRAVDLVHDLLATTAIFTKSPLERQFRDIHTASAHVMVGPLTYEAAGRVELGLPAGMPFF